jgi:hypothetical protein
MQDSTSSQTKIIIDYWDGKTARSVQSAIEPDNIGVPEGVHIITLVDLTSLIIEVDCEKGVGTLVATLDDLLSCIQAAEKALEEVV